MSTSGREKVLYSFTGGADGAFPAGGLLDVNGTLYGMAGNGSGCNYAGGECGTIFGVSKSGAFHVIHNFQGAPNDGTEPFGNLINVNGILYGATQFGGSGTACPPTSGITGCGTVFRVTTSGKERVLHNFKDSPDGYGGQTTLLHLNGVYYGTTDLGGSACGSSGGCGTVFSLTP